MLKHLLSLALSLVLFTHTALAQQDSSSGATNTPATPAHLASPRATMTTFLKAMNDIKRGDETQIHSALTTLDLSDINAIVREERGTELAWILLDVMDRTRLIELSNVPKRETGKPWIFSSYQSDKIVISRHSDGRWLFDQATLNALSRILDSLANAKRLVGNEKDDAHLPLSIQIRKMLPSSFKDSYFLIENWRWLALLLIVALGVIADWATSFVLRRFVRDWLAHRSYNTADISEDMLRPLSLMVLALVWWSGITAIGLPETALLILLVAVKFLASLSGVWAAYRLVDLIAAWLREKSLSTENKIDDVLFPLIPKTLKIFVTVVGIVFIADNLNIDVSGLLAGLGLGGLAFALAAKDMIQNLFGSVTVLLDRTFTVGDWIVVDNQEGTVEHMGFRSTRIRTFYNSLVTIPNATFITAQVDNMGERQYRRYSTKFGIAYETPVDNIDAFCEGIREIIRQHPYMRKDYFHVYLNDLGASSLDVLVYVFWETPDWATELRERHRFLSDCLRLAKKLNVEYAYPTQTLYMNTVGQDANTESATNFNIEQAQQIAQDIVNNGNSGNGKPPPVNF